MSNDENYVIGVQLKILQREKYLKGIQQMSKEQQKMSALRSKATKQVMAEERQAAAAADKTARARKRAEAEAEKAHRNARRRIAESRRWVTSGLDKGVGMLASTGSSVARTGGYVGLGVGAAGAAGLVSGLGIASKAEQTNIGYKSMLGSQQAATSQLDKLRTLAFQTPFSFKGLSEQGQRLLAYGFQAEQLVPTLTKVGNAVAALGGGEDEINRVTYALGQMQAAGKINTKDMMQLTDVGIAAWDILAKASGRSVAKVREDVEKGIVGGPKVIDALLAGMDRPGLMNEQSKTLQGRWSNFIERIQGNLYKVNAKGGAEGTLAPLVEYLKTKMPGAEKLATKGMNKLGSATEDFVGFLGDAEAAYRRGGVTGLLDRFGEATHTGGLLSTIWSHLSTDSKLLASIWRGSLGPSAKIVGKILGGELLLGLEAVQGILRWMADHPTAASIIFTSLGIALITYGTAASILKVVGAFGALRTIILETAAAYRVLAVGQAAATGTGAAAGAAGAGGLLGFGKKVGGFLKSTPGRVIGGAGAAVGGWELGSWLADQTGMTIKQDGTTYTETINGIQKPPGMARGGTVTASGRVLVGDRPDRMPEVLELPRNARVKPLTDAERLDPGSIGGGIVIHEGAIHVDAADYLQGRRVAKTVVSEIRKEAARK